MVAGDHLEHGESAPHHVEVEHKLEDENAILLLQVLVESNASDQIHKQENVIPKVVAKIFGLIRNARNLGINARRVA